VLSLQKAATLSGSSLLTLGFATADGMLQTALVFSEAAIGLILVALMIAYLPTIYSAFSKRELAVAMLEVRAGSPASAIELLERFNRLKNLERMRDLWLTWESWFAEIEENHTSLPVLSFFRSPQPDRSWVTAAGAVLDAASLSLAALDIPREGQAALCIRAGYVSLRRIADYFGIVRTVPEDTPDGIYIGRDEFDAALDRMVQAGIPIKADRDQAWKDFVGWRINYEAALLALCTMTMAPEAPWSSDRAPRRYDAPSM
jgi:AcrR family transcriptional regulator